MLKNKIDKVIVESTFYESDMKPELLLKEDLGIDSLGIVQLIVKLEETFNIEFAESDLDPQKIQNVESVHQLVEAYVDGGEYDL